MPTSDFVGSFSQGNRLLRQGDNLGAMQAYLHAIDGNPKFSHYYLNFSEALLASGLEGEAANAWLRKVTVNKKPLVSNEVYKEVRQSRLVNGKWYIKEYHEYMPSGVDPILHYLILGWRLKLNPCRRFDGNFYLKNHASEMLSHENPLLHYLRKGKKLGKPMKRLVSSDTGNSTADLAIQLWSGHSLSAINAFQKMYDDKESNELLRWNALWQIARWVFFCGDVAKALEYAVKMEEISDAYKLRKETVYLKSFCLMALNRGPEALTTLKDYLATAPEDADAHFAVANAMDNDADRVGAINKAFAIHGFSGIRLKDSRLPLSISNVIGVASPKVHGAQKVSIVMPIYSAGEQVRVAIESLLAQTYQNIEIIAVDDCSPDNTFEVLKALEKEDARVKAVQPPQNGGAYAARNFGLAYVTGDLITTHDSDDWSHPQKIATQVKHLEEHPNVKGCAAHWIRVRDNMAFTQNWRPVKQLIHWSQSSFMFRREVVETLGGWDNVRIGGDTEYIWRMQAHFGDTSLAKIYSDTPLAFALDEESSLTRTKATHVRTVYFGLRHVYREICRWWHANHKHLEVKGDSLQRAFPAPRSMFERSEAPLVFDIVIAGDFSRKSDCQQMVWWANEYPQQKIALFHWPDFTKAPEPLCNEYFESLQQGKIEPVVMGQKVQALSYKIVDSELLKYPLDGYPDFIGFHEWEPL